MWKLSLTRSSTTCLRSPQKNMEVEHGEMNNSLADISGQMFKVRHSY